MAGSFNTSSRFVRLLSVLAATVITSSLFAVVAIGLTGVDEQPVAAAPAIALLG